MSKKSTSIHNEKHDLKSKSADDIIYISNLHKYYHGDGIDFHALKGVNLTIKRGEYVSIIGPSGSGKSTLLHIMGLFDEFDNGTYFLEGIDVRKLTEAEKASVRSKKIGFVFQMFYLIPSMNVIDNIILPGLLINRDRSELEQQAKIIAERFGIGSVLNKTPNKISGGQMQRVALCRALINSPSIILADEPTGNLDSISGKAVLDLFDQLNKEGKTIVIITHDMDVAKRAHRTVKILDGELTELKDFKNKPTYH